MFKVKILSLFLIPFLFYGALKLENFIPKYIREQFTLGPNALWYHDWQKTPIPVLMKFYFFNWTNHDEFSNRERKLIFSVTGPYAFLETKEKVDIEWREESVSFKQLKHWYYQPQESKGSLNDPITSINILLVFALNFLKNIRFASIASMFLQSDYFMTRTVDQLLFTGYEDTLLNMGSMLPFKDIPNQKRFGWFYEKNGTTDFDGLLEAKRFGGDILKWNNQTKTTFFTGSCSEIRGSAGELWPMSLKGHYIEMFSPNLCKTFRLNRNPKPVYIKGIQGVLYEGDNYLFDNGQIYEENECFCTDEHCLPSGAQSVAKCRYNSPTYVSSPHFLNADSDYYRRHIEIPPANKSLHNTFIILEPRTGIALKVAARFQINVLTDDYEFYTKTRFRSVLIPLLWFEQTASISDRLAFDLKMFLFFDRFYSLFVWLAVLLITFVIFYVTVADILLQLIRRREHVNIFTLPKLSESTLKQLSNKKTSIALQITPIRSVSVTIPETPIILTNLVSNSTRSDECSTMPVIAGTAVPIVDSSDLKNCDLTVEKEPEPKIEDSVASTEHVDNLNPKNLTSKC